MTSQIKVLPEAVACKGISVRTTNIAEISHDTAKLGRLWQKFHQNHVSHLSESEDIYGVYHNYETNDEIGAFDVVASWKIDGERAEGEGVNVLSAESVLSAAHASDVVTVTIPAGEYLVFSEYGNMPNTVMNAWEKVSEYFTSASCEHVRAFNVDFEHYIDGNLEHGQVDLYIGIE